MEVWVIQSCSCFQEYLDNIKLQLLGSNHDGCPGMKGGDYIWVGPVAEEHRDRLAISGALHSKVEWRAFVDSMILEREPELCAALLSHPGKGIHVGSASGQKVDHF